MLNLPPAADLPDDPDQALIYLIGILVVGVMGALTFTIKSWSQAKAANEAVDSSGPRLYDKMTHVLKEVEDIRLAQEDFTAKGWTTLPSDIATSAGLTEVIRSLQNESVQQHNEDIALKQLILEVRDAIKVHDEWERSQKYH